MMHRSTTGGIALAAITLACASAHVATAAPVSYTGTINDNDGFVSNGKLVVTVTGDVGAKDTSAVFQWAWDHDSKGNKNVPVEYKCKLAATAGQITACAHGSGTNATGAPTYYWFEGSMTTDVSSGYTTFKGSLVGPSGLDGSWTASNAPPGWGAAKPVQVHLALGYTVETMAVAWATFDLTPPLSNGTVVYGKGADLLSGETMTSQGDTRPFTVDTGRTWYTHMANMTGLRPSTKYHYKVCSIKDDCSEVFSFVTQPKPLKNGEAFKGHPELHVLLGDMGSADAFTLCSNCSGQSLVCDASTCKGSVPNAGLISEVGTATHLVHVGDFAYNLENGAGTVGDQFMANIEQVAARIPYMTSIGNHENSAGSLAHYTERFRHMPTNSGRVSTANVPSDAPNNWYFSWDAGLVHYVAMSTEIYFGVQGGPDGTLDKMYDWMERDLAKAQANRANVPWIVVHGHRSIYCSCDGDCDGAANKVRDGVLINGTMEYGMEKLLFKHGVDLFVNGHEHDYERSWPVFNGTSDQSNVNPKGTIYIVSGSAGSVELHEPFTRVQPEWSAFRTNTFGYSRMYVHNHTHLRWQQIMTDPTFFGPDKYGEVVDDAWIIQHDHGPFDAADAPSGYCPEDGCADPLSYDHWLPKLNLGREHEGNTHFVNHTFTGKEFELIHHYRKENGQGQWRHAEYNLMSDFQKENGGAAIWEDVHTDGNSDGRFLGNNAWSGDESRK